MTEAKTAPLLLATACGPTRTLAEGLGTELTPLPSTLEPDGFERWREGQLAAAAADHIVVCVWPDAPDARPLVEVGEPEWRQRFELPYLLWNVALGAAGRRCADGGSIVALVQAPPALDSAGLTPESAIADGVLALIRSVAAAEGRRGVRANLVTTPIGLVRDPSCLPAPPLAGVFPGRLENEVAGSIRLLLSNEACGLTGRCLPADGGRTL
jgi:NAD(P)-dependent dehydrogenase (short-subunit alcohol dehydrogenase family)